MKWYEVVLKILTLGIYHTGKISKDKKKWYKNGQMKKDVSIDYDGTGAVGNNGNSLIEK